MSNQSIYLQLINAGLTPEGASGLMGNMMAESTMKSNIAQRGLTNLTDEQYTMSFNAIPSQHIHDSVGYGLCQWTYWSRKKGLSDFAKQNNKSVGDESLQVDYCIKEMKEQYPKVWQFLKTTNSVYDAAAKVCKEYEQPAVNNIQVRANYGQQFYNQFKNLTGNNQQTENVQEETRYWPPRTLCLGMSGEDVKALQGLLCAHGYAVSVNGTFDQLTKKKILEYQNNNSLAVDGIAGKNTFAKLFQY